MHFSSGPQTYEARGDEQYFTGTGEPIILAQSVEGSFEGTDHERETARPSVDGLNLIDIAENIGIASDEKSLDK